MVSDETMKGEGRGEAVECVPDGGSGADRSCGPTVCRTLSSRGKHRDEDCVSLHVGSSALSLANQWGVGHQVNRSRGSLSPPLLMRSLSSQPQSYK